MKIKRIIVDELPETCDDCAFCQRVSFNRGLNYEYWCPLVRKRNGDYQYGDYQDVDPENRNRLPSCPLQLEQSCGNCEHRDIAFNHHKCQHEDGLFGHVTENDYCSRWEVKK